MTLVLCCFQEMLISPALLDFLEQAIEPIPIVIPLAGTGVGKGSKNGECFVVTCDCCKYVMLKLTVVIL